MASLAMVEKQLQAEIAKSIEKMFAVSQGPAPAVGVEIEAAQATPPHMEPGTLTIMNDLLDFLSHGNRQNAANWTTLANNNPDEAALLGLVAAALKTGMRGTGSNVALLRKGIVVGGLPFALWNEAPHASFTTATLNEKDFDKNRLRVSETSAVFVAKPPAAGEGPDMRSCKVPDLLIHVNGIYYSVLEIKALGPRQSAQEHGRDKIIGDYCWVVSEVLRDAMEKSSANGGFWPGYANLTKEERTDLRLAASVFERAAWAAAVDEHSVFLMPRFDLFFDECATQAEKGLTPQNDADLKRRMLAMFTQMPQIPHVEQERDAHLHGLLHPETGVGREIRYYHYAQKRIVATEHGPHEQVDTWRPRTPQRVVMERITTRVAELYQVQQDSAGGRAKEAAISKERSKTDRIVREKEKLLAQVNAVLPELDDADAAKIVEKRMPHRNNSDIQSILIQGAAGVGKTHLAILSSLHLVDILDPEAMARGQVKPMFERVVILTDRLELRENIARAALEMEFSGSVVEAKTAAGLERALTGAKAKKKDVDILVARKPVADTRSRSSAKIVVTNLQKFPNFVKNLNGTTRLAIKGRTAFIIDEVHRSQNGTLHKESTGVFQSEEEFLGGVMSATEACGADSRNLIIGLTATPSDEILARFGEWSPSAEGGSSNNWRPFFSYSLNQAVKDGYVLDPTQWVVPMSVVLDFKPGQLSGDSDSVSGAGGIAGGLIEQIYENEDRQKHVAEMFAPIFASLTMSAIREQDAVARVGRGKAMVTVPSIDAAVGMQKAIKAALKNAASNACGKPWENYSDIVADVAEHRVFVLFSDREDQGKALIDCASFNNQVQERELVKAFKANGENAAAGMEEKQNAVIIVVNKLLTGFDEPTLHTLLIDRPMKGIALLQAMCRVNRIARGKSDALILTTCHDETVSSQWPQAFEKYGEMTRSTFDGGPLIDTLNALLSELEDSATVATVFGFWTAAETEQDEGKIDALRKQVVNEAGAQKKEPKAAQRLRDVIGKYLKRQCVASAVMRLDQENPKHSNPVWLASLGRLHGLLRMNNETNGLPVELDFSVKEVGFADPDGQKKLADLASARRDTGTVQTVYDWIKRGVEQEMDGDTENQGLSVEKAIERLQQAEELKEKKVAEMKAEIQKMYATLDQHREKANNDSFGREIRSGAFAKKPYVERAQSFCALLNGGVSGLRRKKLPQSLRDLVEKAPQLLMVDYVDHVRSSTKRGPDFFEK